MRSTPRIPLALGRLPVKRAAVLVIVALLTFQSGSAIGNGVEQVATHFVAEVFPQQEGE